MSVLEGQVGGAGSATHPISIDTTTHAVNVNIVAATMTTINAGSDGTAGTVEIWPTTASKGHLEIAAADNAGDTLTTITNASQAGARTYTVPDVGASANFVMTVSGTASATAGAATLAKLSGVITSEALTTAAGSDYTLTITNSLVAATDLVFASVAHGTNTTEGLSIQRVTPGSSSIVIKVRNTHATDPLNGTIKISFFVVKV
jgi:hypothetical protein